MTTTNAMGDPRPIGGSAALRSLRPWLDGRGPRGAVVWGELGVGRSHLLRSLLPEFDASGWRFDVVVASEAARAVPLGALAHLLPPVDASGHGQRLGLLPLAHEVFRARGASGPYVVVVDDAHLLDDASVTVLQELLRAEVCRLLLTVRSDVDLAAGVDALAHRQENHHVTVEPLNRRATEALATSVLGDRLTAASAASVWERTRGIPLYVTEYLRAARQTDGCVRLDGQWELPRTPVSSPRLARLLVERLDGLTDDERTVVELLAVGEPLPLALLETIVVEDRTLARLETRGILRIETSRRRTAAALSRPLDGDVQRGELPLIRRRAHARQLAAAASAFPARRRGDELRIAVWQLEAGTEISAALALAAGYEALRVSDGLLAARLADAAEAVVPGFEAALIHGQALAAQGRFDDADDRLELAFRRADDDADRAQVAAIRAQLWFFPGGDWQRGVTVLEEALSRNEDPDARVEMEALRALFGSFVGDLDTAMAATLRGQSRQEATPRALVATLVVASLAAVVRGQFHGVAGQLEAARELEPSVRDRLPLARMQMVGTEALASTYSGGPAAGGLPLLRDALRAATGGSDAAGAGYLGAVLIHLSLFAGDVELAESAGRDALVWLEQVDPVAMMGTTLAHLAYAATLAGQVRAAETRLRHLADKGPADDVRAILAVTLTEIRCAAIRGRLVHAQRLAVERSTQLFASHPMWSALIAHEAIRVGVVDGTLVTLLDALAEQTEGELVALFARHGRAVEARDAPGLEVVARQAARLGLRLVAAEASVQAAYRYRRGRDLVGAARSMQRAERHAGGCPGAVMVGLSDQEWLLTPRETQIARMAATGATDRRIAAELTLSTRTVSNHLRKVYRKLQIEGRGGLASVFAPDPSEAEAMERASGQRPRAPLNPGRAQVE